MSKKTRILVLWFFLGGFISYVLGATLDATFLTVLDQEEDWCAQVEKYYDGPDNTLRLECVEYKDVFAFVIQTWNEKEAKKKPWLMAANYCLMFILLTLVLLVIPKWRKRTPYLGELKERYVNWDEVFEAMLYTFGVTFLAPWVFIWILPAPVEWFPSFIVDLESYRVDRMMEALNFARDLQQSN